MKSITVEVAEHGSQRAELGNLILSARTTYPSRCEIVVGSPGLPNVVQTVQAGDAVLFESTSDGILEVRVLSLGYQRVQFLITQISPRGGIRGGVVDDDPRNLPFTPSELNKIGESLARIKADLGGLPHAPPEQLDLISRKLDEIRSASERLGRKDWVNYVAGTLTSLCISAAFAPDTTRALFKLVSRAFEWLFEQMSVLLQ
jgi:hypothetical protein